MYITDLFRRYTRAHSTQSKCKDVVVSKIIELWFPIFGNPDMFLAILILAMVVNSEKIQCAS